MHQAFHIDEVTDAKVQEEKVLKASGFGFMHEHPDGEKCNQACHAIMAKPKDKR